MLEYHAQGGDCCCAIKTLLGSIRKYGIVVSRRKARCDSMVWHSVQPQRCGTTVPYCGVVRRYGGVKLACVSGQCKAQVVEYQCKDKHIVYV